MNHLSPESMLDHLLAAADPDVAAHLRECRDCAAEFQALERAQEATADFYRREPSPVARPLEDRILKNCFRPKSRRIRVAAVVSIAACLLIVASLYVASYFANRAVQSDIEATAATTDFRSTRRRKILVLDRLRERIEHFKRGPSFIEWFLWVSPGSPDNPESVLGHARRRYFSLLEEAFLSSLGTVLQSEISYYRNKEGKTLDDCDKLHELTLAYQILCGKTAPDPEDPDLAKRVVAEPRYVRDDVYRSLWTQAFDNHDLQDLAYRQLEFYWGEFAARDSSRIPDFNSRLVEDVNNYLGPTCPPEAAYADVRRVWEQSWRSQDPDQGQNVFSDAAGSEYLQAKHTVPGYFTQSCFNGYIQPLFKEHAKAIARQYQKARIERTAKDVEDYLYERYKGEYAGEWSKFIEQIEVLPFGSVQEARDGLLGLSGASNSNPAIAKIIREVWNRRVITIDGTAHNVPKRDTEWLKLADNKLIALAKTIDNFILKTREGQRFRDYGDNQGKVRDEVDVDEAFKTALSGIGTLVEAGPEQAVLIAVIHRAREAFVREAGGEVNRYWSKSALAHFKKTLAGKYPFVRTAEIDSTTKDFNEFFKPETGLLAKIEYYLKTLHDITIDEKPLVKYTPEYEAAVAYAQRIRAILYSRNKSTVSTKFTVQSTSPQGFGYILVKVKDKEVDLKSMIRYTLPNAVWEGEQSVHFKLAAGGGPSKILYEDKKETYWGLFRLCDSGRIKDKGTGKDFELSWEYLPELWITLTLTCDDKENPFAPEFFSKFACPEKVAE